MFLQAKTKFVIKHKEYKCQKKVKIVFTCDVNNKITDKWYLRLKVKLIISKNRIRIRRLNHCSITGVWIIITKIYNIIIRALSNNLLTNSLNTNVKRRVANVGNQC